MDIIQFKLKWQLHLINILQNNTWELNRLVQYVYYVKIFFLNVVGAPSFVSDVTTHFAAYSFILIAIFHWNFINLHFYLSHSLLCPYSYSFILGVSSLISNCTIKIILKVCLYKKKKQYVLMRIHLLVLISLGNNIIYC